jgi:hypothetical protein
LGKYCKKIVFKECIMNIINTVISGVSKMRTIPPYSTYTRFQDQTAASAAGAGKSIAISGDGTWVASGAPTGNSDEGIVYVAHNTGSWAEVQELSPSVSAPISFGSSVAIDSTGQHMIISAPLDDFSAVSNSGAFYYFTQTGGTWTEQQRFSVSDLQVSGLVGNGDISLSASGDVLVVCANNVNAAYVFTRSGSTWSQQQKISNPGNSLVGFSTSIALSGDGTRVAIGNPEETVSSQSGAGEVYVYLESGGTWSLEETVTDSVPISGGKFGRNLAIDNTGSVLLIGSESTSFESSGSAFIFTRSVTTWSEEQRIDNPDPTDPHFLEDLRGNVSMNGSGSQFILSSPNKTYAGNGQSNVGAVYVYTRTGSSSTLVNELLPTHPFNGQPRGNSNFGAVVAFAKNANVVATGAESEANDTLSTNNVGSYYIFNN